MRLSIFTTITDPVERGDNPEPAFDCYRDLADEVVIVDGSANSSYDKYKGESVTVVKNEWPKEFNWKFFGEQFQRGYEACTGDWVLRADLDYIFHEQDFDRIRQAMRLNPNAVGLSFYKYQFILPDRFNVKSRLVVLVNKGRYGDRIRFDGGDDLCQVTFDGQYIDPQSVPEAKVPIYNYEKILKTREQIASDVGRMERAWKRYYGRTQYRTDGTDENALKKWLAAQQGKFNKPQQYQRFEEQPRYIKQTIRDLKPENFGYNGFGLVEGKVYA